MVHSDQSNSTGRPQGPGVPRRTKRRHPAGRARRIAAGSSSVATVAIAVWLALGGASASSNDGQANAAGNTTSSDDTTAVSSSVQSASTTVESDAAVSPDSAAAASPTATVDGSTRGS